MFQAKGLTATSPTIPSSPTSANCPTAVPPLEAVALTLRASGLRVSVLLGWSVSVLLGWRLW